VRQRAQTQPTVNQHCRSQDASNARDVPRTIGLVDCFCAGAFVACVALEVSAVVRRATRLHDRVGRAGAGWGAALGHPPPACCWGVETTTWTVHHCSQTAPIVRVSCVVQMRASFLLLLAVVGLLACLSVGSVTAVSVEVDASADIEWIQPTFLEQENNAPPKPAGGAGGKPQGGAAGGDWRAVRDPTSGRTYWVSAGDERAGACSQFLVRLWCSLH
jgi:hypothetical protein